MNDETSDWPVIVESHLKLLRQKRQELDVIISTLEEAQRCGCDVIIQCPRITPGQREKS